ncbi:MAG: glycosyltransferase family 9 protein [Luteolibacter sp.]
MDSHGTNNGQEKILVIKLGALGDIILAMEAFHAVRAKHPAAHISLLTREPFVKLTSQMPWFDEVVVDTKPKFHQIGKILIFRKMLRGGDYTRVYDLQGNDRSGFYFKLMGPGQPEWCGTVNGCSHRRHDHRKDPVPATERMLRFLESVDVPRAGAPELGWLSGSVEGLGLPEKFVVLIPGCAPQHPHKRWPAEHFAKLAELLAEKGIGSVALGTAVDGAVIEQIRALAPGVVSLAGKTDIGQLAEVARRSEGAVGNDTGPVHIAAVAGAPTLSLMSGKSDPLRMTPRGPDVGFLQKEDLKDLSPEEVMQSLRLRKA